MGVDLLVLDFDGTLAPIRRDPRVVRLPAYLHRTLERASARGLPIVILSGRPLSFLRGQGFHPAIRLMGHFGNEDGERGAPARARKTGPRPARPASRWKDLPALRAALRELASIPGVRLERKGHPGSPGGWTVHHRAMPAARLPALRAGLGALRASAGPGARLLSGRKSFELLPAGARTKADALRDLLGPHGRARLLFVGDDASDLAAMHALRAHPRFSALLMGSSETAAGRYPPRLRSRRELARLIARLPGPSRPSTGPEPA